MSEVLNVALNVEIPLCSQSSQFIKLVKSFLLTLYKVHLLTWNNIYNVNYSGNSQGEQKSFTESYSVKAT